MALILFLALSSVRALRPPTAEEAAPWIDHRINGMEYVVLEPAGYSATQRYPVVLYLHQLDMGNDKPDLIHTVDGWFNTPQFRARHPAIIVMPLLDQSKDPHGRVINFGGKREGHIGEDNTIAALREVMSTYSVDPTRIYVTGNSMGGMGAWQMLLAYNTRTGTKGKLFAAGMPVAGAHRTADPAQAATALKDVPIWAIHGAKDKEVSLDWDRAMAKQMSGSRTFHYTEDRTLGHDVWDTYYREPALWDWLFSQSSPAAAEQ
jgi:predicted peptidase